MRLRHWVNEQYSSLRWRSHLILRPIGKPVGVWIASRIPLRALLRGRDKYDQRVQAALRQGVPIPAASRPYLLARFRPIPPSVEEFCPPGRPDVRLVPAGSPLAVWAFWFGIDGYRSRSPERSQNATWAELCASARVIVEIGAHIGTLTIPGARATSGRYVAIEAHPATAEVLRRNLAASGLDQVEVVQAAAVADPDVATVELDHPVDDPYELSTSARVRTGRAGAGRSTSVPARSVVDLVGEADLVKLDVEGLELELLSALRPWLDRARPTMMVEVLDDDGRQLKEWLREFATAQRYEVTVVTPTGRTRVEPTELPASNLRVRFGSNDLVLQPLATS